MKRTTKVFLFVTAVITALWGMLSVASNAAAQAEVTGAYKVVLWYMMLNSVLFLLLSVTAMLKLTAAKKTKGLQKGLLIATVFAAVGYCILLVVNIAPQMPVLLTVKSWMNSGWVMELFQQILYLISGILLLLLSTKVLREKTTHLRELTRLTTVCVCLFLIPYGLQFFGVGLQMVMSVGAILMLTILTVCQAATVYAAFCPTEE